MALRHPPFILANDSVRQRAMLAVLRAEEGDVVEIKEANRNVLQNAAAHACLSEISKQVTWHGQKFTAEVWKRLTLAAWMREEKMQPEMIPALDSQGFDIIYEKSSRLSKSEFSSWMAWIEAFAAQNGVVLKDPRHA